MEAYKEIKSWEYDPTRSVFKHKAGERGSFSVLSCAKTDKCEAYAKGVCAHMNNGDRCPFAYVQKMESPTPRARSYRDFFKENEERHKESLGAKLEGVKRICGIGGNCVYLPIPHLGLMTECEELKHITPVQGGGYMTFSSPVLNKSDFTPENIILMLRMRPRSFLNGVVIKDYQDKSVPVFVRQLKDYDRALYDAVSALMTEEERSRLVGVTNVGRTALLRTLGPGVFSDIHGASWTWDGEWLISTDSHAAFVLVDKFSEVRIRPDADAKVKVTDDSQVNENTVFID